MEWSRAASVAVAHQTIQSRLQGESSALRLAQVGLVSSPAVSIWAESDRMYPAREVGQLT